ncbi:MAG: aldo/keto reductase [Alphaproteobacteria bacterium]|nr:aldo/keto reductase [Alphaproteobacteria bacterium]
MEQRRLGRTGLEVSALGFGAGAVGGLMTRGEPAEQTRALARALEAGITYVDTAPLYGNGASEQALGRAWKELGRATEGVVLGTKVRLAAADRTDIAGAVANSLDASLRRLARDSVDLLQLHNPLVAVDAGDDLAIDLALEQVAPALDAARRSGKTRFVGITCIGETPALRRALDSGLFDTGQIVYNALNPSAGGPAPVGMPGQDYGDLLGLARARDVGTIAIRALAAGALAGATVRHPNAMADVPPIGSGADLGADTRRALRLAPLVAEGHASSLAELGLRYALSQPALSTVLIGLASLDQLDQALAAAARGPLPPAIVARVGQLLAG